VEIVRLDLARLAAADIQQILDAKRSLEHVACGVSARKWFVDGRKKDLICFQQVALVLDLF
jgi:hypothetical protein